MDISVRDIPDELIEKLDKLAEEQHRSRSQQLIQILEDTLKKVK